jgi:hypothetical protein
MNAEDTVLKPLTDYLAGLTPENLPMLRAEICATVHCEQCKEEMDKYNSVYDTALQLRRGAAGAWREVFGHSHRVRFGCVEFCPSELSTREAANLPRLAAGLQTQRSKI